MKTVSFSVADRTIRGVRADKFVSDYAGLFPRSKAKDRLTALRINGQPAKPSKRVAYGDLIEVTYNDPSPPAYLPEPVDFGVLYEDADVVVVNKPQGTVVHPGAGNWSGTLVQGLLYRSSSLRESFPGDPVRPGIVHRLDKDTSGVMVTAKHEAAMDYLSAQFREGTVRKKYYAVVKGCIDQPSGRVETCIVRDRRNRKRFEVSRSRGKHAVTEYRVLSRGDGYSFVAVTPRTGRTHQIRVHMKSIGHPILGDPIYGRPHARFPEVTLMLHAYSLDVALPTDGRRHVFRAPLPERFSTILTGTRRRGT